MKNKFIALVLSLTMLLGTGSSFSHASQLNNDISEPFLIDVPTNQNSINSDEALKTLREYEFTDEEIVELYQVEANNLNYPIELPDELKSTYGDTIYPINLDRASALLSNPKIGTYHKVSFNINFVKLASALGSGGVVGDKATKFILKKSKSQIAKQIIKVGGLSQLFTAMEIAGAILVLGTTITGRNGIKGTQTWYYGEDNHMSIGWTPGYISHTFY